MTIYLNDGAERTYFMTPSDRVYFEDNEILVVETTVTMRLRNLNGEETVRIYALDGRLMKSMEVTSEQHIDISDLPIGLYLLKTERQTLKMIKL